MTEFLLVYAKLVLDKKDEIQLTNVYFWGFYKTQDEADQAASECVNQIKGGTIVPRVFLHQPGQTLFDSFYPAIDWFEKMVNKMIETNKIMTKVKP